MGDNRIWRVRFKENTIHGSAGQFWFQTLYVADSKVGGNWQADPVRFTSFTTEEACNVPWQAEGSTAEQRRAQDPEDPNTHPIGGPVWEFELVGTRIPLTTEHSL